MDSTLFQEHPSGRVVKARDQQGQEYWAFVPAPLPPDLTFDAELVGVLSAADRALGELAGLGRQLPNPHLLMRPFIRREAVLSSRIEGTETDIAGLYAYEAGQLALPGMESARSAEDAREVLNYVLALERGLERLDTLPVSQRLLCEVHAQLMDGVRGGKARPGELRRIQNFIGNRGDSVQDARFVPPPVAELDQCMNDLEKYIHREDKLPPLVELALIHYQFEAVHPFEDGNGRMGRLLIALLLAAWGLLPSPLLYLSAYFERHREDYINLLFRVSTESAWREWLLFFLRGVAEQAQDAVRRVKRIQDLQQDWRGRVMAQGRPAARILDLADHLLVYPFLTVPLAKNVLNVTYPTAQAYVQRLVALGILTAGPESPRNRWFMAAELLQIIGEATP